MSNTNPTKPDTRQWYGPQDMPNIDSVLAKSARDSRITRHMLAPLRRDAGLTQQDIAAKRDITKAAVG